MMMPLAGCHVHTCADMLSYRRAFRVLTGQAEAGGTRRGRMIVSDPSQRTTTIKTTPHTVATTAIGVSGLQFRLISCSLPYLL